MIEALETRHFVNAVGEYLGGFGGIRRTTETPNRVVVTEEWPDVPAGAVEVENPPASPLDRFVDGAWVSASPADNLELARSRINPEMMALLEAVAGRLSVPADDLFADVASRLVQRF